MVAATGIGSMPGTDPLQAVRTVFEALPHLPHLPELPGRGPEAGLVGRAASLLTDLHVDRQPTGWRFVARAGLDERRARDALSRDLDALEEVATGYTGQLKLQLAGPWTMAAGIELHRGDRALADPAAVADLGAALADGLAAHVRDVARRVPGAHLLVQLDEPSLPAVLAGHVRTASGYDVLRAVPGHRASELLSALATVLTDAGVTPAVHCCADRPPLGVLAEAGFRVLSLDATRLGPADDDAIGEALEAGVGLVLGLVPSLEPPTRQRVAELAAPARRILSRLGMTAESLAGQLAVSPTCGLAGASPSWALAALRLAGEVSAELAEDTTVEDR